MKNVKSVKILSRKSSTNIELQEGKGKKELSTLGVSLMSTDTTVDVKTCK